MKKALGIVSIVVGIMIVLALLSPLMWRYWSWGFAPAVETDCSAPTGGAEENSVSCVQRMEPGDSADVFTETWDSETRVWVHKNGGTCEGPYCFSYDNCDNPTVTLTRQPFWTGHELNPVDGKPFEICYDFKGDCAR